MNTYSFFNAKALEQSISLFRYNREFFFGIVRRALTDMTDVFSHSNDDNNNVGLFVRHLDSVLEECEAPGVPPDADALALRVEWMVRFSLSVGKVSRFVRRKLHA